MRLRLHRENPAPKAIRYAPNLQPDAVDYAAVIESPPQRRTILSYDTVSSNFAPKSLWLPYIVFVIRYKKQTDGTFWYGGIYYAGLNVTVRNTPLTSIDDMLYGSPTDPCGSVCTDHRFDNMIFDSAEEVLGTVLDIWWNSGHMIGYPHHQFLLPSGVEWDVLTEKTVLQENWREAGYTLRSLLGIPLYGKKKEQRLIDEPVGKLPSRFFKVLR